MTTTYADMTIEIYSENGSQTQFYQSDADSISKILGQLISPRLFSQPSLMLASMPSISLLPCRTIDMILVRTQTIPPLLFPPGWLDIVEVAVGRLYEELELVPANAVGENGQLALADSAPLYVEINTLGAWVIALRLEIGAQGTIQDQRQRLAHFFEVPVLPFRLRVGGVGFINPEKISRMTVYPAFQAGAETALPADLLRCVRP